MLHDTNWLLWHVADARLSSNNLPSDYEHIFAADKFGFQYIQHMYSKGTRTASRKWENLWLLWNDLIEDGDYEN